MNERVIFVIAMSIVTIKKVVKRIASAIVLGIGFAIGYQAGGMGLCLLQKLME